MRRYIKDCLDKGTVTEDAERTSKEIFNAFAPLEEGCVKTMIPMKEMCPLGDPVARSQARRILRRLDEFREIIFDFRGIDFMGQRLLLYRMDPSAVVDKVKIHGVMSPDRIVGKNGISNLSVGIYGLPA